MEPGESFLLQSSSKISVTPAASLHVHYFWEKKVEGRRDVGDLGEEEVSRESAAVPFCFAVAVQNNGMSAANGVKLISPELEIMTAASGERKKGKRRGGGPLLADFRVLGSMMGAEKRNQSSLEVKAREKEKFVKETLSKASLF